MQYASTNGTTQNVFETSDLLDYDQINYSCNFVF